MAKYHITFKGKRYVYHGANCAEAMAKFANRKVFGNYLIFSYKLNLYDTDTRGEIWAEYFDDLGNRIIVASINID